MELTEIRPFEPRMAEIDLFTMPDAVGVGEPSVRKQKPYIAGHVTDGSSTFTFKVNNVDVTVPVDANGNWKWVQDRDITSLENAFQDKTNIDEVQLVGIKGFTSAASLFQTSAQESNLKKVTFKNCDFSNCTNESYVFTWRNGLKSISGYDTSVHAKTTTFQGAFQRCLNLAFDLNFNNIFTSNVTTVRQMFNTCNYLESINASRLSKNTNLEYFVSYCNALETMEFGELSSSTPVNDYTFAPNLKNLTIQKLEKSIKITSNVLTAQSVVNLFNAVAADGITLTFHATVYAMIEAQLEIEGSPIYEAYWNSDYDFNYASA